MFRLRRLTNREQFVYLFVKLIGVQLGGEFPVTVRGFVDDS